MIDAPIPSGVIPSSITSEQQPSPPQGMETVRPPALNTHHRVMQRNSSEPLTPGSVTPTAIYTPCGGVRPITNVKGTQLSANSGESQHSSSKSSEPRVSFREFSLLKVVGKGSFGKVMQVRKKDTGRIYAMKVLHKASIITRNQVEHTRTERAVLGRIVHPFIVGLNYAFQTPDKLYFVLDYCAGGELFFHLGKEGRFREDRARFYAAQITLALEHLHGMNVIYRDLKPENVLLDHRGNVRLTDFGLSKENVFEVDRGATSFCGTPEYLAPEVLDRKGHGRAVDWWSLGALLYEMLTGLPPFYCKERDKLFESILRAKLEFPPYLSDVAVDICSKLLNRDPTKRLGSGPGDAAEVKAHPFFASVDWTALYELRVPIPFVPAVTSSLDTSQFDSEFTSMPIVSPGGDPGEHISHAAAHASNKATNGSGAPHGNVNPSEMGVDIVAGETPKSSGTSASISGRIFDGFTYIAPHQMENVIPLPEEKEVTVDKGPSFDFTAADRMLLEKRQQIEGQTTPPTMESTQQQQKQQQPQAQPRQRFFTPPNLIPNKGLSPADFDAYVSQVHQHEMYALYDYFCKQLPAEKLNDVETLQHLQQYVKNLYLYEMQTYRQEQAAQHEQQQMGAHPPGGHPDYQVNQVHHGQQQQDGHYAPVSAAQGYAPHAAQSVPDAVPMSYNEPCIRQDDDIAMGL